MRYTNELALTALPAMESTHWGWKRINCTLAKAQSEETNQNWGQIRMALT